MRLEEYFDEFKAWLWVCLMFICIHKGTGHIEKIGYTVLLTVLFQCYVLLKLVGMANTCCFKEGVISV